MKANELMIGDWVRVGKDGLCIPKNTIVKIRAIDELNSLTLQSGKRLTGSAHCQPTGNDFFSGGIWVDYLEPILLTVEILEKNGFKREEEDRGFSEPYCVYVNDDFQYVVKVYPKDGMDRYSRLEIGEYDDNEYMSLLINHVHELQHALRLCEVNKEIEL